MKPFTAIGLASLLIAPLNSQAALLPNLNNLVHEHMEFVPETVSVKSILALDYRQYDDRNSRDSGFRLDRAILRLDGRWGEEGQWRLSPDFRGTDTSYGLEEAWISFQSSRKARVTLGLVRFPLGVEIASLPEDLSFVGYAYPAYLGGRTDLGILVDGEFSEGLFSYAAGLAAGEGFDLNGQSCEEPQLSLQVTTYPWVNQRLPLLPGLFLMAAAAYGPEYESELDVANPLRNKLFDSPEITADETYFLHAGWGLDAGSLRLAHEFANGSLLDVDSADGLSDDDLENELHAWQATVSWMITGEPYDSRPFRLRDGRAERLPARPLWGKTDKPRGWGAWELAARYSNGDIARELFRLGYTDFDESSQEFRSLVGALNWFPSEDIRFTLQVVRTIADQFPQTFGNQGRDTSWVFRTQWTF